MIFIWVIFVQSELIVDRYTIGYEVRHELHAV
jgi:hypothetical protein